jgi:MFS superfamily sulfate permease-like transporter
VADYFSRPVLVGYIHGVVVVLIIGQLGKLTGISITRVTFANARYVARRMREAVRGAPSRG